jgi:hypothetical protein
LQASGFQAVDEREHLLLEPPQTRACLAETPVGVRELLDRGQFFGGRRDIPGPPLAAIGEDGAGVEFSVGAVAVGFSTAAAEGVEGAGEERLAAQEGGEEFLKPLLDREELSAKRTEVVGHVRFSESWGDSICSILYISTYRYQELAGENPRKAKQGGWGPVRGANVCRLALTKPERPPRRSERENEVIVVLACWPASGGVLRDRGRPAAYV